MTDSSGAVLPGAEIELLDTATNQSWKQITNETGQYVFPLVLPGVYNITVTVPGFRKATVNAVKADVAKSYTINVSLEVGHVAEVVEVTTTAGAELQTTDSTIGTVIQGSVMPRFPALTRQANELLMLQALTTPTGEVAGSRGDQTTFLLDGIDVTNQSVGGTGIYTRLPIDGLEEFRAGVDGRIPIPTVPGYGAAASSSVSTLALFLRLLPEPLAIQSRLV